MDRIDFIKKGLLGIGSIIALPTVLKSCDKSDDPMTTSEGCVVTPAETKGPFPNKTPSQLVMENITSDRTGIALLLNLTIQNKNKNCEGLEGALVDVWHCDREGNYSEYGENASAHFLRGRQLTDGNGNVSFITIYPGWYPGRAPHIHLEVLNPSGNSLLVTQIAFPENISSEIYSSPLYVAHGQADTSNSSDGIFQDSLKDEIATLSGDLTNGYTLTKTIVVKG